MKATSNSPILWLQKRPEFRFLGSLKLAIPLLLIVAAAVAWGTIVESKYNAEMAKIVVYNSDWFSGLMALLWLNIFCATVLRYPFRSHHTGFVITHLGLLTLLAGGVVTSTYGIDGSLAVSEGQDESLVSLPNLVFGIAPESTSNYQTVEIRRTLSEATDFSAHNKFVGHIAAIEKYLPFAEVNSSFRSGSESDDVALSFILKSPFFNVSEFLHSSLNPSKQMGPALFELHKGSPTSQPVVAKAKPKQTAKAKPTATFKIIEASSGKTLQTVAMTKLEKDGQLTFKNFKIQLKKVLRSAAVAGGGLSENEGGKSNPALELSVTTDGQTYREVVFARFPDFSLNKGPSQAYKFRYEVQDESNDEGAPMQMAMGKSGHKVRFYFDQNKPGQAELELEKENTIVLRKTIKPGETIETPWMGMQVTLASLIPNAIPVNEVIPTEPKQRENIPQGALRILPKGASEGVWIAEGDAKDAVVNGRNYSLYFGRKMFRLPFQLKLHKFYKKDYPGTDTAMSFESDVSINQESQVQKISMNEPLVRDGYTLYQASFQMGPEGGPAVSIFSVNKDPGRTMKYLGSLILCLGIVIFTIQRSNFYRNWKKQRKA